MNTPDKCPKCNNTEFEDFKSNGAPWIQCKKCYHCIRVGTSPEYEAYIQERMQKQQEAKKPPTATCPYCQSTDTKKISGTSRFMSTGIFGLASGKLGKQWHCNKCKSDF